MSSVITESDLLRCRTIARKLCRRYKVGHLTEDATQEAVIALWQCGSKYSASHGVGYAKFTGTRIKWAVQDYLRRSERGTLRWYISARSVVVPLNEQSLPEQGYIDNVRQIEARRLVATLAPRRREVIDRYYWNGETLLEIASRLGVNESRASQLKASAIVELKKACGLAA